MPDSILKHMGKVVSAKRKMLNLTQQQLADQVGHELRHIQNIEKGRVNPSFEVLADVIKRLGIAPNVLFYPDMAEQEAEIQRLCGELAFCTKEERKLIIDTANYMAQQLISRHTDTQAKQEGSG